MPKMEGSIDDQSCFAMLAQDIERVGVERQRFVVVEQAAIEMQDVFEAVVAARPACWRTGSDSIAANARAPRSRRCASVSSMRLNRSSCRRFTSSANRQNTMRLRKCATLSGAWPGHAQALGDGRRNPRPRPW